MAPLPENKSLPELIGGLASDISGLFRKEIELAKTEVSEKVSQTLARARLHRGRSGARPWSTWRHSIGHCDGSGRCLRWRRHGAYRGK